ncbi:MAG: hypothetical protein IKQ55_10660 [Kiritimatiellae bacterium]|nr:hypothetical protein [Kiritimatiellia bacterium]
MIVPMLKLTLLCRAADRASALAALRDLGVLHVTPSVAPSGANLDAARAKADLLKRVLEAIPSKTPEGAQQTATDPEKLAADLQALIDTRKTASDRIEALRAETARIAPFGTFDPASIPALAEKGITLKLYRAPLKATPDLPEGVCAEQLGVQKTDGYWALFASSDFTWTGAEEIRLPEHSLSEMEQTISTLTAQLADAEKRFAAAAADRPALEKLLAEAESAVKFEEVASGMGDAGVVNYVTGFIPARDLPRVETAAAENGWGLLSAEPGPEDDVPVLLKQPRWARPIQAVFDGINILPGYKEADVSVVFMLFFSLFFAMIIGDAGYGLIFLALTLLFAKKMPANARNLLLVTSSATIVWGLITGSVFGISQTWLADHGFARLWPAFLNPLKERAAQNIMGMCFLIGAIQITIGHVWNIIDLVKQKSTKALEQLGWVCTTWYMFFMADNMVIGGNMAKYIGSPAALKPFTGSPLDYVCLTGIVLIALFMMKPSEIKDGWFNLALLPLNIINNFTDVVSYVRLYAVGAAGFAVANAFNTMIFGGEVTLLSGLLGALFAFLAHTLNILLCVMGVLVHGIRLNTLEFSNHKGISWSGAPYRPFARPRETAVQG